MKPKGPGERLRRKGAPGIAHALAEEIEVVPLDPGVTYVIDWAPISGATGVEVDSASMQLTGVVSERALGEVTAAAEDPGYAIKIPGALRRVRRLALRGLQWNERDVTTFPYRPEDRPDLTDLRLVVSVPDANGTLIPRFAIPPVARTDFIPEQLGGATYEGGILTLPDELTSKVVLSIVNGRHAGEFSKQPMKLAGADVTLAEYPTAVAILGPNGDPIWSQPGELVGTVSIDLKAAIQGALKACVARGEAPRVELELLGASGQVRATAPHVRGKLVRVFSGVVRAKVRGEPVALELPGAPLDAETPASAAADVSVRYLGLRLLPEASDPLPPASQAVGGAIVRETPVTRPLAGVAGRSLGAVGLVGRAPEKCELSVWPTDAARAASRAPDAAVAAALSAPGVARLEPDRRVEVTWIDMPERVLADGVALAARANQGRFFWAAGAGALLARVAVRDADPGSRPLLVDGAPVLKMHDPSAPTLQQSALPLPTGAFAGAPPTLESELFLTVDFGDITLRYAR
ncbi:hypothetical protein [Sorangium sp. So ce542]|uniref:hypothetical protein n=1 Tax=Sorangium sp. So ce542 TaxID=3133316 RepID=UPI003F637C9F